MALVKQRMGFLLFLGSAPYLIVGGVRSGRKYLASYRKELVFSFGYPAVLCEMRKFLKHESENGRLGCWLHVSSSGQRKGSK